MATTKTGSLEDLKAQAVKTATTPLRKRKAATPKRAKAAVEPVAVEPVAEPVAEPVMVEPDVELVGSEPTPWFVTSVKGFCSRHMAVAKRFCVRGLGLICGLSTMWLAVVAAAGPTIGAIVACLGYVATTITVARQALPASRMHRVVFVAKIVVLAGVIIGLLTTTNGTWMFLVTGVIAHLLASQLFPRR